MKLVLFGTGMIGSRILTEALMRGHTITVVKRDLKKYNPPAGTVKVVKGDALDPVSVAEVSIDHDAVLCAISGTPDILRNTPRSLLDGLTNSGVKRLLIVGGAGSLEVKPGLKLLDTPSFPESWRDIAMAHDDALNSYRKNMTINWTFLCPAAIIAPGKRTGKFRLGGDQLITDKNGESHISAEDYAIAFLDEAEKPAHIRQRFTLGY